MADGKGDHLTDAVRALAEPVVAGVGAELVGVKVHGPRGGRTVAVTVDHDDGVGIDLVAEVTRGISRALDADEDLVDGSYTLEVSSPGVDRPLRGRRDFERNVGRDVRVQLTGDRPEKMAGEITGRVVELAHDDEHGEVVVLNVRSRKVRVPLAAVDHAKIVLPW